MRRNVAIVALAAVLIGGIVASFSTGSSTHIRDEITLQPGGIAAEFIPARHAVTGYAEGNCSFTIYLVPPNPNRFGDFDMEHPIMTWFNVRKVHLDFNTTDDAYLVIVAGNCSTRVVLDVRTYPLQGS